jgi:hypothetical protein
VELVTKPSDIKNIKSEVQKLLRYCAQGWMCPYLNIYQND